MTSAVDPEVIQRNQDSNSNNNKNLFQYLLWLKYIESFDFCCANIGSIPVRLDFLQSVANSILTTKNWDLGGAFNPEKIWVIHIRSSPRAVEEKNMIVEATTLCIIILLNSWSIWQTIQQRFWVNFNCDIVHWATKTTLSTQQRCRVNPQ